MNKRKSKAKLPTSERRDARNGANDKGNAADVPEYCSSCGRLMSETGGGDCEQCEAVASDWRDEHPFPDSSFEGGYD